MYKVPAIRCELELLVRQAGVLLMSFYKTPVFSCDRDQPDKIVEQFLIEKLAAVYPRAYVCAEESGISGDQSNEYGWIIDPLDGTSNFMRGFPYFCISVGLVYKDSPVVGIIYQPVLDQLFYAEYGQGASLNGTRLSSSNEKNHDKTMVIALSYDLMDKHTQRPYAVRYCGAAALDCAYVALGALDGLILHNLAWWDIAAGILLLTETGNIITHTREKASKDRRHTLIAARPNIHRLLHDSSVLHYQ